MSAPVETAPTRPISAGGARSAMRALAALVACEAKMVARDTAGLIVPLGMPLLIMVMSASGAADQVVAEGRTAFDLFVLPVVVTIVMAMIGIVNLPSFLATYRRTGVLRRLGVTPVSPALVLVAQAIVAVVQAAAGIGLAMLVAMAALGSEPPAHPLVWLGVAALAMAAMCALGMIVAAVAPTPNSAVAIGLVGFLGLGAMGGMFGGVQALPEPLQEVAPLLPFGASVEALGAATAGVPVDGISIIALGATIAAGAVVASLLFRWE